MTLYRNSHVILASSLDNVIITELKSSPEIVCDSDLKENSYSTRDMNKTVGASIHPAVTIIFYQLQSSIKGNNIPSEVYLIIEVLSHYAEEMNDKPGSVNFVFKYSK